MKVHRLKRNVVGKNYRKLVKTLLESEESFSLVWRDQLEFNPSARAIEQQLLPFEILRRKKDRWPGTRLFGHRALVVFYRVSAEVFPILSKAGSLFSWISPEYPEDIAFYRNKQCTLASVAHERAAWVLHSELARKLSQLIPLEIEDVRNPEDLALLGIRPK